MRLKWSRFLLAAGLGAAPFFAINCPAAFGVTEVTAPEIMLEEDDDDDDDEDVKQKHKKHAKHKKTNKVHKKPDRDSESHFKHDRGSMPAFSFRGPPRFPKHQFAPEGHPFPGSFRKPESHSTSREDSVSEDERRFREEQLELLRNISRSLKSIEGQMRTERQGSFARGMPLHFGQQPGFQGPQLFSPPRIQGPNWFHRPEEGPRPEGGPRPDRGPRVESRLRPEGGSRPEEGTQRPEGRGPRPESSPREPARSSDSGR
ncbi:MAG: hypothetical protein ACK57V_23375 [Pirellula sp.]